MRKIKVSQDDIVNIYESAIRNAISILDQLGNPQRTKSIARTLEGTVLDVKKIIAGQETEKVLVYDSASGKYVVVGGPVAELQALRAKDPQAYEQYAERVHEFMSNFKEASLFAKMFGENGEKILLPEVNQ